MRARLVPALLGLCLLASACSGDDDPPPASLPPVSTSPTPSESAPAVPAEATPATPEGAAAFVRYFYASVATGFQTQDPRTVSAISSPDCATCRNYVTSITTVRDEGLRVEGGDFEIIFAEAREVDGGRRAEVDVAWNFSPAKYFGPDGTVADEGPAVDGVEEQLTLIRQDDSWLISDITRIRQRQ